MAATTPITSQAILAQLQKLDDTDPDFRIMALSDILAMLSHSQSQLLHNDYNTSARTCDGIVKSLDDANGEAQNLAVKCLAPLVTRIPPNAVAPMIDKLVSLKLRNSLDHTIPPLALRTVITALRNLDSTSHSSADSFLFYDAISRVLIPRLNGQTSSGMLQVESRVYPETVDVLIEVVKCFGPMLKEIEIEAMQEAALHLIEAGQSSSVVKKRAVVAIAMLAVYLSNDQLDAVVGRLTESLSRSTTGPATRRVYISIIGSMARSVPRRFGPYIPQVMPHVSKALSEEELQQHMERLEEGDEAVAEFNDVHEASLVALDAFLASCPQAMRTYIDETITSCLRYLKYDPNYVADEDDEDMDEDDQDDDMDDDDEFDADDGFEDDEDDSSWKLRRCAARTLCTLISTRGSGDLAEIGPLYTQIAPPLVKRITEREENVRLEVISALSLLVRETGEGIRSPGQLMDEFEPEFLSPVSNNRKRRRQSSGGVDVASGVNVTSPSVEKLPSTGPKADLARLTPSIVKASKQQLSGKAVATKQAILKLLDDMVAVQRGGLSDYLVELMPLVLETVKPAGSAHTSGPLGATGGSASATTATLRTAALKLIGDICKTHSSSLLQPYLSKIVATVTSVVHDSFYKISSESIRAVEELVKTITPPRARSTGTQFKGELDSLFAVLMDRTAASDADAEVRQRAIRALGILLARTSSADGAALLPVDKRKAALSALRDRLKTETTRLAAVRAVDNVAAFASSAGQFEDEWIQDVALQLCGQFRKVNRSLRGASIVALRHLVKAPGAKDQLGGTATETIVSSLAPSITENDTQLLGPALLILSDLVQYAPQVVVSAETTTALCNLLKSHFAGIVLDQLLELTSGIGKSGAGQQFMTGLLQDVSVAGEPAVTGKVIGALLVTGGSSSGLTVKSFVQELKTSAKNNDEPRLSLALAVLGEAGMRLGAESPLSPDLFLERFHDEPDKVSLSAAIALGRAGSGNVPKYLPIILEAVKQGGNKQYLLIQSIKEILLSVTPQSSELRSHALAIWDQVLQAAENEDNKIVCAECIGRIVVMDAGTFLPKLQELLKNPSAGLRGVAVQAIKYTLPETNEAFEAMLSNVLIDMLLVMLQDDDMEVRRLAMTTLNSAAHNKPDLILPHMSEIMPLILSESVIKPELIREVMLGPFKHTVDDGLEVRKSAYETLYALMETAFTRINIIDFYDHVVEGLKDDNDIRQLCNLMVTKLVVLDTDETIRRLDSIANAYRHLLSTKLKDNSVKQDKEKLEESNKSILRVTLQLAEKMKAMSGNASTATGNVVVGSAWLQYWNWVTQNYDGQIRELREEGKDLQRRVV